MAQEKKKKENLDSEESNLKKGNSKENSKTSKQSKSKKDSKSKKNQVSQKEYDKVKKSLDELLDNYNDINDKYLRLLAEFENFKKRTTRDLLRSVELESEKIFQNILPITDDIDRAMQHSDQKNNKKDTDGFVLIKNKFLQVLKGFNIVPFDSVGKEFDPDRHDALMTRVDNEVEENTVLEEFEKGYCINDKILRHAKVIVSSKE